MRVPVCLNGTGVNPYEAMGLRRNPFPAIANAAPRFASANEMLADLDANPIPDVNDLIARLRGCSDEFVEACVAMYRKGRRVRFVVSFPDLDDAVPA